MGMTGGFALGICAREIEAGCRLAGIARERRAAVARQVRDMGRDAANALNARER